MSAARDWAEGVRERLATQRIATGSDLHRLEMALAEREQMAAALAPLARIADYLDSRMKPLRDDDDLHVWETTTGTYRLTAGDCRRAKAALAKVSP